MSTLRFISDCEHPSEQAFRRDLSDLERQQIFCEMIVHQLSQGSLSRWRRKRIVQYAACLGINAVQAGRLIEKARRMSQERGAACALESEAIRLVSEEESPSCGRIRFSTIAALITGAVMVNGWILLQLFR